MSPTRPAFLTAFAVAAALCTATMVKAEAPACSAAYDYAHSGNTSMLDTRYVPAQRGVVYAQMTEDFWRSVDTHLSATKPNTVGDVLDLIQDSFIDAARLNCKRFKDVGANVTLEITNKFIYQGLNYDLSQLQGDNRLRNDPKVKNILLEKVDELGVKRNIMINLVFSRAKHSSQAHPASYSTAEMIIHNMTSWGSVSDPATSLKVDGPSAKGSLIYYINGCHPK